MDQSPMSSVILSDDRVLNQEEYELIVQDHQLPSNFIQHNLGASITLQPHQPQSQLTHQHQQQHQSTSDESIPLPPPANSTMFMANINQDKKMGQFVCEFCHLPFVSKAKFLRHRRIHTEENPYACVYCTETFSHHLELRKHREERHMTNKSFKCSYCVKTFSTQAELRGHLWRHTGEKNHKCRICGKMFATKGNLKLHIDKHIGIHKHKCPFCPQRFTSHSSLEAHMAKHTGMRSYKCRFCPKTYAQSGQLVAHERLHTGEKPFVCQACGKGFRLNSTRLAHEKRHDGTRPHICDTCGRSFSLPDHLKRHLKTHENKLDRLVACPFCKKKIFAGRNMKKHLIRHRELNLTETQAKAISSSLKPDRAMNERDALDEDQRSGLTAGASKSSMQLRQAIRCSECNEELKSMRKLLEHLADVHYQRELTTIERKELRKRHGLQKLHHCQYCTSYFVDYRLFRSHVVTEHPEHAEYLGFPKVARKNNSDETHKCPNCSLVFHLRGALDEHILKDHLTTTVDTGEESNYSPALQFRCWYCPQHFHNPEEVVSHMTTQHESLDVLSKRVEMTDGTGENDVSSTGLWSCPHCSVSVKSEEEYTAHLTLHITPVQPSQMESSTIVRPSKNMCTTDNSECVIKKYLNLNRVSVDKSVKPIETHTIKSSTQYPEPNDESDLKISSFQSVSSSVTSVSSLSILTEKTCSSSISTFTENTSCSPLNTRCTDSVVSNITTSIATGDINDDTKMSHDDDDVVEIVIDDAIQDLKTKKKKSKKKKKNKQRKEKSAIQLNPEEQCQFCSNIFSNRIQLNNHMRMCHDTDDTLVPFKCWFCSIAFSRPEDAVTHMTNEHDNLDNLSRRVEVTDGKVEMSTEIINSYKLLNRGGANDASLSPVNSLTCPLCPKKLESKEAFELHLMVHEASNDRIRADKATAIDEVPLCSEHIELVETENQSSNFTSISSHFDLSKNVDSLPKIRIDNRENYENVQEKELKTAKLDDIISVSKLIINTPKMSNKTPKPVVTQPPVVSSYVLGGSSNIAVHKCTHCSRVFCGKKALDVHTLRMHGKEFLQKHTTPRSTSPFSCWFCSAHFNTPELVVDHMTNAHENLDELSKRIEHQEMPALSTPVNTNISMTSSNTSSTTSAFTNIAISTALINTDKLPKHIPIAPQKTVMPLPPRSSTLTSNSITGNENIAVNTSHQPPPGFKVSYALAYVPIFVPDKNEDETKK